MCSPSKHTHVAALKSIEAIKSVQCFSRRTGSLFDPSRLALTANSRSTPCRQRGLVDQRGSSTSEPFTKVSVYLLCCQVHNGFACMCVCRVFFPSWQERTCGSACQRINDVRRVLCTFLTSSANHISLFVTRIMHGLPPYLSFALTQLPSNSPSPFYAKCELLSGSFYLTWHTRRNVS